MEKAGQKTRDINFYSEKNGGMICLHSRHARDYAKYLETQSWVERYEAGAPLSQELYAHVSTVGIRGAYFQVPWVSDFLIHFADGRKGIRELVAADGLRRKNIVEKLEFSRRYWAATDIDNWKVVLGHTFDGQLKRRSLANGFLKRNQRKFNWFSRNHKKSKIIL